MIAVPIQPGRSYRVRGQGLDLTVFAGHPCDALCVGIEILTKRGAA